MAYGAEARDRKVGGRGRAARLIHQHRRERKAAGARLGLSENYRARPRTRGTSAAYQATGVQQHTPSFLGLLAGLYIKAENSSEALKLLDEALLRVDRLDERWFEAELHRLKGEALLAGSPERAAEAETCYHRALAVARNQGARLWELRTATSLARLWRGQGRRAEARDLIAPVYGWFTEGFDTADLKDAKALLDELG